MSEKGIPYIESKKKRRMDVAGALFLGALASPAAVAVALETMAENRSLHPLFKQQRPGKDGKAFTMYKFRTLWKVVEMSEPFSGSDDPRASKIARVWRRSGLDELPQLYNVLIGDLSLVGFRSMSIAHRAQAGELVEKPVLERFDEGIYRVPAIMGRREIYTKRFSVHTPQVIKTGIELNNDYLENASLREDVRILLNSVVVLGLSSLGWINPPPEAPVETGVQESTLVDAQPEYATI